MASDNKDDSADVLSRMSSEDDVKPDAEPTPAMPPASVTPRVRSATPVINRSARPTAPSTPAAPAAPRIQTPARPTKAAAQLVPETVPYAPKHITPARLAAIGGVQLKRTMIPICLTLGSLFVVTGILFFAQDPRAALRSLPVALPLAVLFLGVVLLALAAFNMMLVRAQSAKSTR